MERQNASSTILDATPYLTADAPHGELQCVARKVPEQASLPLKLPQVLSELNHP